MRTGRVIVMLDETNSPRRLMVFTYQAVFLSRRRALSSSGRLIPWILRVFQANGRIRLNGHCADVAIIRVGLQASPKLSGHCNDEKADMYLMKCKH